MDAVTNERKIIIDYCTQMEKKALNGFASYALTAIYYDSFSQDKLKDLVKETIAKDSDEHPPIISNSATVGIGIKRAMEPEKARSVFQKEYDNSKDKAKFLHDIICQGDIASACKLYVYMPEELRKIINARFAISEYKCKEVRWKMRTLGDMRNDLIGHASADDTYAKITTDKVRQTLDIIEWLLNVFTPKTDAEQAECQKLCKTITRLRNTVESQPCALSSVRAQLLGQLGQNQETDEYDEIIISDLARGRYDPDAKVFYFVRPEEIAKFVQKQVRFVGLYKELASESGGAADDVQFRQSSFVPLASLSKEIKFFPDENQVNEVFNVADVVLADKRFMLDSKKVFSLRDSIAPKLKAMQKPLLLTWPTRVELFLLEKDESSKEQRAAKTAHNQYHFMHANKLVQYGEIVKTFGSAESNFMQIFTENPETRFVIFTKDPKLLEDINSHRLCNVLPVSINGTSVTLWTTYSDIIKRFAAGKAVPKARAVSAPVIPPKTTVREKPAQPDTGNLAVEAETTLYKDNGTPVVLGKEIGHGGEGTIFEVDGSLAAKIYYPDMRDATRFQKVKAMVSNNPNIRELCWPIDLLYTKGHMFAGFTMPRVNGKEYKTLNDTVLQLSKESVRKELMLGWDRLSLVKTCLAICRMFEKMKQHDIIMGDINPSNILVTYENAEDPEIVAVDTDSMQFAGYPCPVGVKEYTSPEIYKRLNTENPEFSTFLRNDEDEQYALANLLFRILMLNISPYNAKEVSSQDAARREYKFPYRSESTSGAETPDGPYRMIWNNTYKAVKDNFTSVFTHTGEPLSAGIWAKAFWGYKKQIEEGKYTKELLPNMYFDIEKPDENGDTEWNKYFICESCGRKTNAPRSSYQYNETFHLPQLCPVCKTNLYALKGVETPDDAKCSVCGRPIKIDEFTRLLHDYDPVNHPYIHPWCRNSDKGNNKHRRFQPRRSK